MPEAVRSVSDHLADRWESLYAVAGLGGPLDGYYHRNYRVELPAALAESVSLPVGTAVKVRAPILDAAQFNLRIWPEDELLGAIAGRVDGSPHVLARRPDFTVYTFAEGASLADITLTVGPVGGRYIDALARIFRQTLALPGELLPPLPGDWPADGDCAGFLRVLVEFTQREVIERHGPLFGDLFAALGVPENAYARLMERAGQLGRRPFALLHTDIHRGNVIVGEDGRLSLIDWELALYGDPVYELAAHLNRMRYGHGAERRAVHRTWRDAVAASRPEALAGHRQALCVYLDFERLLSVHIDVIRGMDTVRRHPRHQVLKETAARIHTVLLAARGPLGLRRVPSTERVAALCASWMRRHSMGNLAADMGGTWRAA